MIINKYKISKQMHTNLDPSLLPLTFKPISYRQIIFIYKIKTYRNNERSL